MHVVTGSFGFIGRHLCRALRDRGVKVYEIDLFNGCDINTCELPDADRVWHLAAQTDAYCKDAQSDAYNNIIGSLRIFERYGNKVVLTSSAMVNYPCNPYAISKRACEDYAKFFGAAIVRLPNVYGQGGHSLIDRCSEDSEIKVYGTGEQRRTYQHVSVVVDELLSVTPGSLKIVSGVNMSVNQIVAMYDKPKTHVAARDGDLLYALQLD